MAIVFISPKKTQKKFFTAITVLLPIFLAGIFLWVFLSQPSQPAPSVVFNKPKVNLNASVLDSDQFKDLEKFEKIPLQFTYTATNKKNKIVKGTISAVSKEEALKVLQEMGLTVGDLKEVGVGRTNPFIPYSSQK